MNEAIRSERDQFAKDFPGIADVVREKRARREYLEQENGMVPWGIVADYFKSPKPRPTGGLFVYVETGGPRFCRVGHVTDPGYDAWCPEENGGFGCSWAVHGGTRLYRRK